MTKKIIASFLGLAMALMMVPGMAQGQTVEELQDQIADLLAQITLLQAQVTALTGGTPGVGVPAACTGITFTVDLSQGSTGNDVKCLQALLNTDPVTQLGTTGAGSPGSETTYFGPLTHAAVVKFQDQHAAEILTPIGLTSGTGYVGPATRPVLNAMLTAVPECTVDADCLTGYICVGGECMPAPECTLDADCPTGYTCEIGTCQREDGEAAEGILTAQVNPVPASGVKIYEGNTDVAVLGLLLKAKLSDIDVQRITFSFGATRIYDYLTYLGIYDGDTLVKGVDLNSSTVYKSGGIYYLQVTGFSAEALMDGSTVLTVKVNAAPGYASWLTLGTKTITVPVSGIRGVDTAGIIQYAPATTAIARSFSVNTTLAASAALTVSRHTDSPLPYNIGTGSLGTADGVEVLRFNVKAEYDDVKITDINNVVVAVGGTGGATSGVSYLYDGDTVVNSAAIAVGTGVANFTDMEIMVAQDTSKPLIVKNDYTSASTTLSTSTVTVNSATVVAENSLGMVVTSLSGTAVGYPVYIYTIAPVLALSGAPTITQTAASEVASSTADAVIKFTMTAEGGDVTVTSTGAVTAGYTTTTAAGVTVTGVAVTYDVAGAGTPSGGVYTIAKDTAATITVDVHVDGGTVPAGWRGAHGYVTLTGVTWNGSETTNWMADIFKTGKVLLP